MARNRLQERDNNLPDVDYEALLKAILAALKKHTDLFTVSTTNAQLQIQAERVALEVANAFKNTRTTELRPFFPLKGLTHSTANFPDGEAFNTFRQLIERVQDQLASHLKTSLAATFPARTTADYLQGLISGSQAFTGKTFTRPSPTRDSISILHYGFAEKPDLSKRRLHLQARQKPSQKGIRLLGHKLTITIERLYEFEDNLVQALCTQLEMLDDPPTPAQIERARAILQQRLQDETSEQGLLKRIIRKEAFGRLQKEAKIRYLEYLADAMKAKKAASVPELQLLQNLTGRLRMLEAFLRTSQPDAFYQVSYQGIGANYLNLFSRAEVLNLLPIFSDIEGSLGETFDKSKGEQAFTLGIKLKLNGHFRTYKTAFEYYLKLLDPQSTEHKERLHPSSPFRQAFIEKVLKLALLYYFVFKKMDDPSYNPAQDVEAELLNYLKGDDNDEAAALRKQNRLSWLVKGLSAPQYTNNLQTLKSGLRTFVESAGSDFEHAPSPLYLSVDGDILDLDEDRMKNEKRFFHSEALGERGMRMLKYITIQGASAAGNSLCSLPVTMTFEPIYYYPTSETAEKFSMAYNIRHFDFLPVIYAPDTKEHLSLCQHYYQAYPHILIPYAPTLPYAEPAPLFLYHFTYLLLTYMCLKLFHDQLQPLLDPKKRLFFPLMRIHQAAKVVEKDEKRGEEEYLRALSKTQAHLLCEQGVLANAQGLFIDILKHPEDKQSQTKYKLPNALSSLYSVLPKVFTLPTAVQLDHLAVIVVSGRKCDAHRDSDLNLSTIYGEVIGIRRLGDPHRVQVTSLGTFAANEASDNMYRTPTVLQDQAKNCYERGYKHILYIAQAPYSSFLHLTSAETAEEQFFMSGSIIQSLKQDQADAHIYPVYCDKFYVVSLDGKVEESLYVDDTRELRSIVNDPNRSAVVFFNLLNGKVVNTESFYKGVVSYSTLINVYDDPIYDQDIRNHLLDGSQPGSLKKDILSFLMLLHFARYERDQQAISFKLDPYENIIGFDSVGTLSVIDHMEEKVNFNMLGFLTEVRSVLNRHYSGYNSALLDEKTDEPEITDDEQENGDSSGQL